MSQRIAVVGSRRGADLDAVDRFIDALRTELPDATLVSGGADGVDRHAERRWHDAGGRVISLRPTQTGPDEYRIERWELNGPFSSYYIMANEPSFADYASAALYRDILIADETCDRLVAFQKTGGSRGTMFTVEMAKNFGKPTYEL